MPDQTQLRNRLLAGLSADDFAIVSPSLVPVTYARGRVLVEPNAPVTHAVFPETGMASVVACTPGGYEVEAGVIGREGFVCSALALGIDRIPHRISIQMPTVGYSLDAKLLKDAIAASRTLHQRMLKYVYAYTVQTSCTVLSSNVHSAEERLSRWLLMCHDRSDDEEVRITHEFLALVLAVRRPTVTNALHMLEGYGFIRADRGSIRIRDRAALQAYASDIYGMPEAEYERVLGGSSAGDGPAERRDS